MIRWSCSYDLSVYLCSSLVLYRHIMNNAIPHFLILWTKLWRSKPACKHLGTGNCAEAIDDTTIDLEVCRGKPGKEQIKAKAGQNKQASSKSWLKSISGRSKSKGAEHNLLGRGIQKMTKQRGSVMLWLVFSLNGRGLDSYTCSATEPI